MNHNIRYELRPDYDMEFAIEVSRQTLLGNIGPDSLGEPGLSPQAMVFSLDRKLWWYSGGGFTNRWINLYPDPGAPAGSVDDPAFYRFRLSNPISIFGGAPAPFPFEGVYYSDGFTQGHQSLVYGGAEDPLGIGDDGAGNWSSGAISRGYLIFIDVDLAAIGAPGRITEYLQLAPFTNDVNVISWRGSPVSYSSGTQLPNVNVAEYKDDIVATSSPGIPEVNMIAINNSLNAASAIEDLGTSGYDSVTHKIEGVKLVDEIGLSGINSNSFDAGAITSSAIASDAIDADAIATDAIDADAIAANAITADAIATDAIDADAIAPDAIDADSIASGAITADAFAANAIEETAFDAGAISARVIATDAIDADAIQIDSVTYEELSDSAVREIVNGIWNTSVFGPIDQSADLSGTNYSTANPGTMGHAMLVRYLSESMIHASAVTGSATPVHTAFATDPAGMKFYSSQLASQPLTDPDEIKSYANRTAVIFKGLDLATGAVDIAGSRQHLVRISDVKTDGVGQYFEVHLLDEDESPVPNGIEESVGPNWGDILLVKAETDTTASEIAHAVWEEPVADHSTPDTFGMLNRIMAGLSQFNHQITDSQYDPSGRLLSCRLVVYANSDDARSGTNPLTTIEVSSSYDEKQNMISFVAAEEK